VDAQVEVLMIDRNAEKDRVGYPNPYTPMSAHSVEIDV